MTTFPRPLRFHGFIIAAALAALLLTPGASGKEPLLFSDLPVDEQRAIETRVAAPPTAERDAPYSTPMYYLMARGFHDGINREVTLERNRPDWQEALIRDWAELGLTSTLYLTTPADWDDESTIQAIRDLFEICERYGLRVGVRLAGDENFKAIEGSGWNVHPLNPENRIDEYVAWCGRVARELAGRVDHYIIGDEVNANSWEEPIGGGKTRRSVHAPEEQRWTPEIYMQVFTRISGAIKEADPAARVSMFGMGGLDWDYVQDLLDLGYADHADGVAANFGGAPIEKMHEFVSKVHAAQPDFGIYSNGVGYISARDTNFFPTNTGNYKLLSDRDQAVAIAKTMFTSFESGWDSAPYYILVRQWQLADGSFAPHWYGFYGVSDLVLDDHGNMRVHRYPGWYAFQTIAHVFHDRGRTKPAPFDLSISEEIDHVRAFVRDDYECLLVLWNDGDGAETVSVTLPTKKYTYPVQVSLFNHGRSTALPYELDGDGGLVIRDLEVGDAPVIVRLVAEPQQFK